MNNKNGKTETQLRYEVFLKAFADGNPLLSKPNQQKNAKKIWCQVKDDPEKYDKNLEELRSKASQAKAKLFGNWAIWSQTPKIAKVPSLEKNDLQPLPTTSQPVEKDENANVQQEGRRSLKQEEKNQTINNLKSKLVHMTELMNNPMSNVSSKEVAVLKKELNDEEKSLKRLASCVQNSKKYRDKKRKLIQKFCNQDEKVADTLKSVNRAHVGRPSILEDHPQLLQTIADIVEGSSSADDRRRSETIRSCKTVSDVTEELIDSGIDISRSGTYLHVLPRIKNSIEGRRLTFMESMLQVYLHLTLLKEEWHLYLGFLLV